MCNNHRQKSELIKIVILDGSPDLQLVKKIAEVPCRILK